MLASICSFYPCVVTAFLIVGFAAVTLGFHVCTVTTWVLERANALVDFESTYLIFLKIFPNMLGHYLCSWRHCAQFLDFNQFNLCLSTLYLVSLSTCLSSRLSLVLLTWT